MEWHSDAMNWASARKAVEFTTVLAIIDGSGDLRCPGSMN